MRVFIITFIVNVLLLNGGNAEHFDHHLCEVSLPDNCASLKENGLSEAYEALDDIRNKYETVLCEGLKKSEYMIDLSSKFYEDLYDILDDIRQQIYENAPVEIEESEGKSKKLSSLLEQIEQKEPEYECMKSYWEIIKNSNREKIDENRLSIQRFDGEVQRLKMMYEQIIKGLPSKEESYKTTKESIELIENGINEIKDNFKKHCTEYAEKLVEMKKSGKSQDEMKKYIDSFMENHKDELDDNSELEDMDEDIKEIQESRDSALPLLQDQISSYKDSSTNLRHEMMMSQSVILGEATYANRMSCVTIYEYQNGDAVPIDKSAYCAIPQMQKGELLRSVYISNDDTSLELTSLQNGNYCKRQFNSTTIDELTDEISETINCENQPMVENHFQYVYCDNRMALYNEYNN